MREPNPVNVTRIDHLVLRSPDPERLIAFYRDVLGCRVERQLDSIGLVQLRAGDSLIDIVPAEQAPQDRNLDHFCLQIAPWDAARLKEHFARHGIDLPDPVMRYGATGDGPSIYLDDPDGNTVELKGPPAIA